MSARIPSLKRELEDNVAEDITNDNEAKPPASDIENADNIVIDVPNNLKARTDFILQQRRDVIQKLCQQSRNGAPNISVEPARTLVQKLTAFMRWLENSVEMTPELRSKTQIDKGLFIMYQKPGLGDRFTLPDRFSAWAERLVGKCKEQKWGAGEVVDEEEEEEEDIVPGRRASASAHKRTASTPAVIATTLRPPPSGHPMFGEKGIMHGVVMKIAKVRTWVLDSRYPKKDAKVYGHNDGGISGNKEHGAYSVVVSGMYDDLDHDFGDTLFYSGSNSHDNTDPKAPFPSSAATQTLHASLRTRRPLRVLRSSNAKSRFAPRVGLRYDGLYQVVSAGRPKNSKGGLYEQSKLERIRGGVAGDQEDITFLARNWPSAAEQRDFDKIQNGY